MLVKLDLSADGFKGVKCFTVAFIAVAFDVEIRGILETTQ